VGYLKGEGGNRRRGEGWPLRKNGRQVVGEREEEGMREEEAGRKAEPRAGEGKPLTRVKRDQK